MTSLQSLPIELLAHILELSNEGETAQARQHARFSFGLIARAFFLATADATEFYVAGEAQAQALVQTFEREKEWRAQEERKARSNGRTLRSATLRITRISNIRRLFLTVDTSPIQKSFAKLLRSTPNLVALDLAILGMTFKRGIAPSLEIALGELTGLRELRIQSHYLFDAVVLRILIALKAVRVINIKVYGYLRRKKAVLDLTHLSLAHLHTLRIRLLSRPKALPNSLLHILATSPTTEIQVLDLGLTDMHTSYIYQILPLAAKLVHLTWTPDSRPLKNGHRDAVLELLAAMKHLKSVSLSMWTTVEGNHNLAPWDWTVDHSLFNTLATLPSLQTVELIVKEGRVDKDSVISFIKSHKALRSLSILFRTPSRWTREQRERVEEAAELAGVALTC